jgi:CcmD family protein
MVQPGEGFQAKDLVAAAYGFIWVMVAGFVWLTWRRSAAVERELTELQREIERRDGGAATGQRK